VGRLDDREAEQLSALLSRILDEEVAARVPGLPAVSDAG